MKALVLLGGVYNLGFIVFHLMFWRLFRWPEDLVSLSFVNRAAIQILNLCLIFAFAIFAYVSLFHADELLSTPLGRALLLLMAIFWLLRALEQIMFFGLRKPASLILFVVFVAGGVLHLLPFASNVRTA